MTQARIDGKRPEKPRGHVAPWKDWTEGYDPKQRVPCPQCGLPVGIREGRLNRHRVGQVAGKDVVEADGVRSSPLREDGWCRGSQW